MLADKIFEPLDALLMAYESWLKFGDTLEGQWEKYPNLELCHLQPIDSGYSKTYETKKRTKK